MFGCTGGDAFCLLAMDLSELIRIPILSTTDTAEIMTPETLGQIHF